MAVRTLSLHLWRVCAGGDFLEVPEFNLDRLRAAWQEAVFALYLAEDKIEPEVVESVRRWRTAASASISQCS